MVFAERGFGWVRWKYFARLPGGAVLLSRSFSDRLEAEADCRRFRNQWGSFWLPEADPGPLWQP